MGTFKSQLKKAQTQSSIDKLVQLLSL